MSGTSEELEDRRGPKSYKMIAGRKAAMGKDAICRHLPMSARTLTRHIERSKSWPAARRKRDPLLKVIHQAGSQYFAFVEELDGYVASLRPLSHAG